MPLQSGWMMKRQEGSMADLVFHLLLGVLVGLVVAMVLAFYEDTRR